ncbi:MAG: TlpA family protein disulfide reductase [Planctomycetes bacterium]|nr:TlpA family protein disulfide reductase [Planctomycetota bacterium]
MWQQLFEKYGDEEFTVVGLAIDAEGIVPAKRYYDKYGVTFPSLVDPDYATQFGAVPKTFFVDEQGVVQDLKNWEQELSSLRTAKPVTREIRSKWSKPESRLESSAVAELAELNAKKPNDLAIATQLCSRYLALGLHTESRTVLNRAVEQYDVKAIAKQGGSDARLLGQAYFQLMRSHEGDRAIQEHYATTSYYLNPSIGFAKQIARIIDPEKFDQRSDGSLDDTFRQATYVRLKRERAEWLAE